ncbi:SIMPL domain-containing protein [Sphingomonas mucosissima]|uniref:26 kDa periplasmic immunogenic protein n=1 Tax=Sphingomonas mucosissima TaxID=370959 RepID=A0A245ZPQ2_9SPHN|nr:SIMPL domain-containing protein [Sphingomonas mucosissima]OWK31717.1 26 kDa periplasmic immunogenic protein precursor [Sphingomonas mucosissima]
MRYSIVTLAMAALAGASAPAAAQVSVQPLILPDATVLNITATGEVSRVPDVAVIRAGVVTQAATAAAAVAENSGRMERIVAALRSAGIASRDIMTANVGLSPQYRYGENQPPVITGYQATNTVSVKFREVAKSGGVLDALVKAGANQIDGPQMLIDKPAAALDAARIEAVKQARARAALYAQAAGLRVDRIVSIEESGEDRGNNPRPPVLHARAEMASDAQTPVLAGETTVSATVNVRFLLK